MEWIIYKHTLIAECAHKGWSYIGQTCYIPTRRWHLDGSGYAKNTAFGKAIQKYGWENFNHEILEQHILSQEEANAREIYWIAYYHTYTYDKKCMGYNMTWGGEGQSGFILSDESKNKISQTLCKKYKSGEIISSFSRNSFWKGKKLSYETRTKMSEVAKQKYKDGRINPNKGKHMSEAQKEKIRLANTGYIVTNKTKEKLSIATSNTRWVHLLGQTPIKISVDELEIYLSKGYLRGTGKKKEN